MYEREIEREGGNDDGGDDDNDGEMGSERTTSGCGAAVVCPIRRPALATKRGVVEEGVSQPPSPMGAAMFLSANLRSSRTWKWLTVHFKNRSICCGERKVKMLSAKSPYEMF